jgi:ribosomal-protein-alanine N-acetyltransferase
MPALSPQPIASGLEPPPFPALGTARLQLREIVAADAPALFSIHGDHEAMRWFGSDPLPDLAAASRLVEAFAALRSHANPGIRWGLQAAESETLVGSCGLFAWNRDWKRCAVGYELAPFLRGRGLMREALAAALSWAFEKMDLNSVEAKVHPENTASIRLLHSLGFVEEGRLRQAGRWCNRFHDLLQYSLLRSEWRPAEPASSAAATCTAQA